MGSVKQSTDTKEQQRTSWYADERRRQNDICVPGLGSTRLERVGVSTGV